MRAESLAGQKDDPVSGEARKPGVVFEPTTFYECRPMHRISGEGDVNALAFAHLELGNARSGNPEFEAPARLVNGFEVRLALEEDFTQSVNRHLNSHGFLELPIARPVVQRPGQTRPSRRR